MKVSVRAEILRISCADETHNVGPGEMFAATCAVKVASGDRSFMLLEVSAMAATEGTLAEAIMKETEKRIRWAEERALGSREQKDLQGRFPKTLDFELDMNEAAFDWIVQEQRKHPV